MENDRGLDEHVEDPENDAANMRTLVRSPLVNRLPKDMQDIPGLELDSSMALREGLHKVVTSQKIRDSDSVEVLLRYLAAEVGENVVMSGIKQFTSSNVAPTTRSRHSISVRGKKVCVTFANGYLSSHIVKQLLQEAVTVVGAVVDMNDASTVHLTSLPHADEKLTLVQCNMKESEFSRAFEGCDTVIHSGWPAFKDKGDEASVLRAIKVAQNVMSAAASSASVRTIVITSSTAAVRFFSPLSNPAKGYSGDEWSDEGKLREHNMRGALRTLLAEQKAWEIYTDQLCTTPRHGGARLKLATICVGQVIGPSLRGELNSACSQIRDLIEGRAEYIPNDYLYYVDVRDAANAHVLAALQSYQRRMVCVGGAITYEALCDELTKLYKEAALPARIEEGTLGPPDLFDTSEAKRLGVTFRSLNTTLNDMAVNQTS